MKRIIEGRRYDTESAELITEWSNSAPVNDFSYCREELYRTKNGNWFIYGEGGAMSRWSKPAGDGQTGGEDIQPLYDKNRVIDWLENKRKTEILEEYFPEAIADA